MTYLKSFELFEAELNNTPNEETEIVNEAAAPKTMFRVNPKAEAAVKAKLSKMKEDQILVLKDDVLKLAKSLGLKPAEMSNPSIVAAAIAKKKIIAESADFEGDELNEGMMDSLKAYWEKSKEKFYNWMSKIGLAGAIGGIITGAYGASMMPDMTYMPSDVYAEPNTALIAGGIATLISVIAIGVGVGGEQKAREERTGVKEPGAKGQSAMGGQWG